MVNVGDTILVTIPTYWPGLLDIGLGDPTYALQTRLQQAGVEVVNINPGALSYWGDIGSRSDLLITVRPFSSAFGNVQDVSDLVAGVAYAVGFDINAGATGAIIGYSSLQQGQPSSSQYDNLQKTPDRDPNANKSIFEDIAKALGISVTSAQFGAAALGVLVLAVLWRR